MSKRQFIILLALILVILPFLGFTSLWNKYINVFTGIIIVILAYRLNVSGGHKHASRDLTGVFYSGNETKEGLSEKEDLPFVEHRGEVGSDLSKRN